MALSATPSAFRVARDPLGAAIVNFPVRMDGDELDQLAHFLDRLAFGDDRARMLAEKRRVLIEAGVAPHVIDTDTSDTIATH